MICMCLNAGIKYDAEKEERQLQEARQRELQRIEETKQKAAEKGARNLESGFRSVMSFVKCSCLSVFRESKGREAGYVCGETGHTGDQKPASENLQHTRPL